MIELEWYRIALASAGCFVLGFLAAMFYFKLRRGEE